MNSPMPTPPNLRRSPASPWKNRSKIRSWSPSAMPMPSSSTVTSIHSPAARARTCTVPPSGEYLKAFSRSWPTMMSVAIVSPLARGRPAGMSVTTACLSDSGWNAAAAPCRTAARSNGPLLTGSWSAPAREPSSSCSTRRPSDPARSAMIRTAARRSVSGS